MLSNQQLEFQAMRVLAATPALLVMLVGVILAIRELPLHPRTCWALLGALALSGFSVLGLPFLMSIVMQITGGFASTKDLMLRNFLWSLPYGLVNAATWGLILFAVFDRPPPPKFLHDEDGDQDLFDR